MPFTSETDHKIEWIYSGKHIVPFKTKNTETFTKQINTRSNVSSEENLIKSFYYDITKLNNIKRILKKKIFFDAFKVLF